MRHLLLLLAAFFLTTCSCDRDNPGSFDIPLGDKTLSVSQFVKQTIALPFPAFRLPFQQRQVDAEKGGRLTFSSGTEIDIPARAFVYSGGEPVTGLVNINVREFHNTSEIIVSGFPMRDWNEEKQVWENFSTAGMFEITGTDEAQQAVEIAPNRSLEVHFVSEVEGTYGYWYFDEEKGDWELKGQNTAERFSPPQNQTTTDAVELTRPKAPRKFDPANGRRMIFKGSNIADFSELNDPEKIALQYVGKPDAENAPQTNQWIFNTQWYKVELTKTAQAGIYQLFLQNDDKEFTTQVQPTLLSAAYEVALSEYRQKLAAYEAAIANMEQSRQRAAVLRRSMPINRFGIYNYDIYSSWKEPVFANANFKPSTQNAWTSLEQVYLITDNGRITVRYPNTDWSLFNFDRSRRNLLLGITSDSKIVLLSPEDFIDQAANLETSTNQQQWDCVLKEKAFELEDLSSLQHLIDTHFAS